MKHRSRPIVGTGLAVSLAAAVLVGATLAEPAVSAPAAALPANPPDAAGPAQKVTLITGDQVVLDGQGKVQTVIPAEGRDDVPISVRTYAERTLALPADAAPLVARGLLDERLFDVTTLVEFGYDDRDDLPVIVTGVVRRPRLPPLLVARRWRGGCRV